MKSFLWLFCLLLAVSCQAPTNEKEVATADTTTPENTFNAELAQKYGADDYGMKSYVMAFLHKRLAKVNF